MIKKTILLGMVLSLPLSSLALAQAPPASGQILTRDDLDALVAIARKDTLAHKADIVAKNMTLDGAQASAFWPLYKKYEAERQSVGKERFAIIGDLVERYGTLDDATAKGLVERYFANEDKRLAVERKYKDEMLKVLPAKLVARFFQVDRRINMLIDLTLSSKIPLVQ
jgi:hypothetical protein